MKHHGWGPTPKTGWARFWECTWPFWVFIALFIFFAALGGGSCGGGTHVPFRP